MEEASIPSSSVVLRRSWRVSRGVVASSGSEEEGEERGDINLRDRSSERFIDESASDTKSVGSNCVNVMLGLWH